MPTTVLNAKVCVQNKLPLAGDLVKKIDYEAKISEIEGKCITTSGYNKLTSDLLDATVQSTDQ